MGWDSVLGFWALPGALHAVKIHLYSGKTNKNPWVYNQLTKTQRLIVCVTLVYLDDIS